MKNTNISLVWAMLVILSTPLFAQYGDGNKYTIQFDYGISNTLHYNRPVNLRMCFEGCNVVQQTAKAASNFNLNLYRNFNSRNGLKLGIGFSEYRFWQKEMLSPGDGSFFPYESTVELKYFTLATGYRHIFEIGNFINPFFEAEMLLEVARTENDFLKKYGAAIKPKVGALIKISNGATIVFNAFYKSGIVKYNDVAYQGDYVPFGYGAELGLNLRITGKG